MYTPSSITSPTNQINNANELADDFAGVSHTKPGKPSSRKTKAKVISRVARSVAENIKPSHDTAAVEQSVSAVENSGDNQQQILQTLNKTKLRNFFSQFVKNKTNTNKSDIKSLINHYVASRSGQDEQLIQALAKDLNFYGGNPGEDMDPAFKASLKSLLITSLVDDETGQTNNRFDFNGFTFKQLAKESSALSLQQVKTAFTDQLGAGYTTEAKNWLATTLLADKDPTLALNSPPNDITYGGFAWAELYAGIVTAKSLGIDPNQMSPKELTALVNTASEVAVDNQNGNFPPQALATLLYADAQGKIDLAILNEQNADTLINQAYDFVKSKINEAKQVQQAIADLSSPPPTRSDIAKQVLREYGYNPEQEYTCKPMES
ncbi:hypothetical protein [Spartinivicinus ruber]|uniref:hypothetical protein n=1 Tax=Spartinivicinus ruber TaxID=2683272 RepID=UPI0013D75931|nr:hypothetical protein [Spartinivicinus ruber]